MKGPPSRSPQTVRQGLCAHGAGARKTVLLERHKPPKLTPEKMDKLDTPLSIKEMKFIPKNTAKIKFQAYVAALANSTTREGSNTMNTRLRGSGGRRPLVLRGRRHPDPKTRHRRYENMSGYGPLTYTPKSLSKI